MYAIIYYPKIDTIDKSIIKPIFVVDEFGNMKTFAILDNADELAYKLEEKHKVDCVVISLKPVHE